MSVIVDSIRGATTSLDMVDGLIIAGTLLVVVTAFIIWWRSRPKASPSMPVSSLHVHSSPTTADHSQPSPVQQHPVINRNPKNPQYLKEIEKDCYRIPGIIGDLSLHDLKSVFRESVFDFIKELKNLNEIIENGKDSDLAFKRCINFVQDNDLSHIRKSLIDTFDVTSGMFIELTESVISNTFKDIPPEYQNLRQAFTMTVDKKHEQEARIAANLKSIFSEILVSVDKARSIQAQLGQSRQIFESYTSNDIDIGGYAKHFGAGALAVVNPLIGIPALLGVIFGENEKSKKKSEFVKQYVEKIDEVANLISSLDEPVNQACSKSSEYVTGKFQESFCPAVIYMFQTLDKAGVSLKAASKEFSKDVENLDRERHRVSIR